MLPARHRLRTAADFTAVVRGSGGARSGGRLLVVHGRYAPAGRPGPGPTRAGFVVSKAVGTAVTRNRVKRVLRHLVAARLPELPDGLELVVRANPASATATTPELSAELDRSVRTILSRLGAVAPVTP